jgi:hypothetical protein
MIYTPSRPLRFTVKQAQIEHKKAKEELRPFYTNFGTGQSAVARKDHIARARRNMTLSFEELMFTQ